MSSIPNDAVRDALACPQCAGALAISDGAVTCPHCAIAYHFNPGGQLDLRLKQPKSVEVSYTVGPQELPARDQLIHTIPPNPSPDHDWGNVSISKLLRHGNRLTPELLGYFPRAKQGGMMLDLGCGYEDFREICGHTNMEYVGVDYDGPARILADGHALPFKDESFDFMISFAVLEHVRYPSVAWREAHRVLKRGGRFIGSVAFIEPFHLNSYYHFSPLGVLDTLAMSGFRIEHVEPNRDWPGLRALGWMSLFPHAPRWLSDLLVLPLEGLHRLWWKAGNLLQHRLATSEATRQLVNAGGFRWVCHKP